MDLLFIIALFITSIISVTFMVERGWALRWTKVVPPDVQAAVIQYQSPEDLPRMKWTCEHHPSALSRLLHFAAQHLDWPKNENVDVLETRARHEVSRLERGLVVLEIIVGIAPLLGLVGTIYGLILLFGGMGDVNVEQTGKFAQGVSLALNATLFGLLIAIPSLIAWSYYSKKVENLSVEMETLCDEFLRKHYHWVKTKALAESNAAEPEAPPLASAGASPEAEMARPRRSPTRRAAQA
jgi:biopolymer transport protein ExbB